MMGILHIYTTGTCVACYISVFQFAYKVKEKLEELKKLMEIKSILVVNSEEKKYWARVFRSIPRTGMRLGGFGQVEREAVPIYIDFSTNQIVSLLLAFN